MIALGHDTMPHCLRYRQHRDEDNFDDLSSEDKDEIKRCLLDQQGHLCAYCMSRIRYQNMKVEHIKSRSEHPELQLEFKNLAACCKGEEGEAPSQQHCDTRKGGRSLPFEINDEVVSSLSYSHDGKIASNIDIVDDVLNGMLNLNMKMLCHNRKKVIECIMNGLSTLPKNAGCHAVQKQLEYWKARNKDGKLSEYAGVAIYFLTKRLHRCI